MKFTRIEAVIIRHFYEFKHNLDRLTDSFYWPAIDIILWGLTSQYIQDSSKPVNNIVLALLSAIIFWQIIWRGQYEITVNLLDEMWNRNLTNLFASPLEISEWVLGVLILGIIKLFGTIGFAILLAWILYSVNIFTFGWLLIPFFISLLMVGWWIGLFVASLIIIFGTNIQTIAWSGVYILAPFSAIFYPVASLPAWARAVASFLPSSYIFEGMREVLLSGSIPFHKLAISFCFNIIYLILSTLAFKWAFAKSKEKGLARLE